MMNNIKRSVTITNTTRTTFVIAGLVLLLLLPLACTSQEDNGEETTILSDSKNDSPEVEEPESRQQDEEGDGFIKLTGKLSVKESAPHTKLVLTTSDGKQFQIVGDLEAELRDRYQYRTVTLKGEVVREAIGPGFPAQFEAVEILNGP